jgi:hypothetical protein
MIIADDVAMLDILTGKRYRVKSKDVGCLWVGLGNRQLRDPLASPIVGGVNRGVEREGGWNCIRDLTGTDEMPRRKRCEWELSYIKR